MLEMKLCEYGNNLLSLHLFSNSVNKIDIHIVEHRAVRKQEIMNFYQGLTDINFTLKVLKPRTSPLDKTKISYVEFANKFISKYGVVPMELIIFTDVILLREIIMTINPYQVILMFR